MLDLPHARPLTCVLLITASACSSSPAPPTDGGSGLDARAADASGSDSGPRSDAGPLRDAGGAPCVVAADCQDGMFCNGYEACAPGTAGADARGCVAGSAPCTGTCDEATLRCAPPRCDVWCADDAACGDAVACNGTETCGADGACAAGTAVSCPAGQSCREPSGACVGCPGGCDDGAFCNGVEQCVGTTCAAGTPPCGASGCSEARDACTCTAATPCGDDGLYCNGIEFCDPATMVCGVFSTACPAGQICLEGRNRCGASCSLDVECDDGIASNGLEVCSLGRCLPRRDVDVDGHRDLASGGDDCNDNDATTFPGNPEVCDAVAHDEDCDSSTFGSTDVDGDGFVDGACCNVNAAGVRVCGADCDDHRGSTSPVATEVCNGIDDDCDGVVDDGVLVAQLRDRDGDGGGDPSCASMQCSGTTGWALQGNDCDDTRSAIHDGTAVCDPAGAGVRTCTGGVWVSAACPAGTTCRPQPGGTGLCL